MIQRIKKWMSEPQLSVLAQYFGGLRQNPTSAEGVVLVQCVEDLFYFGIFGQVASSLRERKGLRVEQYVLRSLAIGESKTFFRFIAYRVFINSFHNFKWTRLYRSFCDGVAYRSASFRPIGDLIDFLSSWRIWRRLADRDSLIALNVNGVPIGDLINDSYLRFKPAATVYLKDLYLFVLVWQAHRDLRRAREYFIRVRPELYLTSYSTYIQHGIPVRVALQHGVRVFSFGNYQEFTKELTLQDWVHTKKPDNYAIEFQSLDHKDERLALAEKALSARLKGELDNATAYMKKSAYSKSDIPVPEVKGAVVIFLHDFYDSPHVYREMVFPDFWEWVCFTIETLQKAKIPFLVKPHPNQINLNDSVLDDLQKKYPGLSMISSNITNKQLSEAGLACAITVYGSVAHEMAYLGVASIACAHHPHISFSFCRTARNREEYANFLQESTRFQIDKSILHQESLMFYYMHNLNLEESMKSLKDAAVGLRVACDKKDDGQGLVHDLKEMARYEAYQSVIAEMV